MTQEILLFVFFVTLVLLILLLIRKNEILKLVSKDNQDLKSKISLLDSDNLGLLKKIGEHESNIKNLEFINQKMESLQESYLNQNKVAMYEISSKISSDIANVYKNNLDNDRKIHEEVIQNNVLKFNEKFEKISSHIEHLNTKFKESEVGFNLIKNSLLNPISSGKLAEITLENLLMNSGLTKDLDYFIQPQFSSDENVKMRPDAVVYVGESNFVVIDAKSSKFFMELDHENEKTKENLINAINSHIKSLSSKEYTKSISDLSKNRASRSFTLMFLQTEAMVEKISRLDFQTVKKANECNIFIVGPSSLLSILSLIRMNIENISMSKNQNMIIDEISRLIDSISIMNEQFLKFGNSIQSVVKSYDKIAASFNRTFVSKVKKIQKLGINSNKKSIFSINRYQIISTSDVIESDAEDLDSENIES